MDGILVGARFKNREEEALQIARTSPQGPRAMPVSSVL